jgi:hypothetical protein
MPSAVPAHPNLQLRLAAERCTALSAAMRHFTHLTVWVTIIGAVSVAVTVNGDQAPSTHTPPDGDHFSASRLSVIALQFASMLVIWWMARVPLQSLRDAHAHGRLWRTLRFGCSAVAPAVSISDDPPQQLVIICAHDDDAKPPLDGSAATGAATAVGARAAAALSVPGLSVQQPLDSAASKAVSGLSMRSGRTSVRAVRRDAAADDDETIGALSIKADLDGLSLHARTQRHSATDRHAALQSQQRDDAEPWWIEQQTVPAPTPPSSLPAGPS